MILEERAIAGCSMWVKKTCFFFVKKRHINANGKVKRIKKSYNHMRMSITMADSS